VPAAWQEGVGGGSAPAAAPVFKKGVVVVVLVFSQLSCVCVSVCESIRWLIEFLFSL